MTTLQTITASMPAGTTTAASSSNTASGVQQAGLFASVLQSMNQTGGEVTGEAQGAAPLIMLVPQLAQSEGTETLGSSDLMQMLSSLLSMLETDPAAVDKFLEENPQVADFLMQVQMMMNQWMASDTNQGFMMLTNEQAQDLTEGQAIPASSAAMMQRTIQQLVTAMQSHANDPMVEMMAQSFGEQFKPLLMQAQGLLKGSSLTQTSDSTAAESTEGMPQLASTRVGESVIGSVLKSTGKQNAEQAGQAAEGRFQAVATMQQSMDHLARLQAKSALVMIVPTDALPTNVETVGDAQAPVMETTPSATIQPVLVKNAEASAQVVKAEAVIHANELPEQLTQFVKSMKLSQLNGISEARISLRPEHLGQVDIRLSMQNGQLTASFVADTMLGKELLDSQLGQLKSSLQLQGVQVERIEVSQQSSNSSTPSSLASLMQDSKQQGQQFLRQQQGKNNNSKDSEQFNAELEGLHLREQLQGGSSFVASA